MISRNEKGFGQTALMKPKTTPTVVNESSKRVSMLPGVFPPGVLFAVRGTNQEQLFTQRTISRGRATLT